jgi:predicted phosphodiesterase
LRYLVVSDLHANREALEGVLADAAGLYERIVCCGDIAGYGPDPNYVIDWVRDNVAVVIRGNHDRACAGLLDLDDFNPVARAACLWTMRELTSENISYLTGLSEGPVKVENFQLAHGSPLDEDEYLLSLADARPVLRKLETSFVFFGHTHLQGTFSWMHGRYLTGGPPAPSQTKVIGRLDPEAAWLVNPGAVGQPRDQDARAAYAVFDTETYELMLCRAPYDSAPTRHKILSGGLPDVLARRLILGR